MSEREPSQRVEFLTDLAAVVDGDDEILAKHHELLQTNEAVRELRAEARALADDVAHCGDDFRTDAGLTDRLLEAVGQRAGTTAEAPTGDSGEAESPAADGDPPAGDAGDNPAAPAGTPDSSPRRLWLVAGAVVVIAAVAALASLLSGDHEPPPPPPEPSPQTATPKNTLGGKLTQVAGEAADVKSAGGGALSPGAELKPGEAVTTGAGARAALSLDDGSSLVLNHDTRIVFDEERPRTFRVTAGEVLASVAPSRDGPMRFETPTGSVEVTGTKLALTVAEAMTSVRVTRGEVRIARGDEAAQLVEAGQEGLLPAKAPVSVVPMMHLSSTLGWSELGDASEPPALRGLGELRAHVPGEREAEERPLSLAEHHVDVRIAGNVARTEVEEYFRNDGAVDLEGVYRFPLPPGARIADLALEVDGEWQRGAFVERERGKKIWRGVIRKATKKKKQKPKEDFIWVPGPWRDPALLEWQQGGRFELRIFPIPAGGGRRVRLTYTEVLEPRGDGRRYVYPLPHAGDRSTAVGEFSVRVSAAGDGLERLRPVTHPLTAQGGGDGGIGEHLGLSVAGFQPNGDLIIDMEGKGEGSQLRYWSFGGEATVPPGPKARAAREQAALHADDRGYAVLSLRPELPAWTQGKRRHYVLLLDSSQSMFGERYARARGLAERMVAEMDRRDTFTALACDATCQTLPGSPFPASSQAAAQLATWLEGIRPAGASDLGATLSAAASAIEGQKLVDATAVRIIYVGDGVASIGSREPSELAAQAAVLTATGDRSLLTVGIGADADALVLSGMARAGRGHFVPYTPGQPVALAALSVLETGYGVSLTDAKLTLPEGLDAVAPASLPSVRAGEELVVAARVTGERVEGEVKLEGKVGGKPFSATYPVAIEPQPLEGNRFAARLWAAQRIEDLQLTGSSSHVDEVIALSRAYGVMSRHTSLLVLESEAMFRAFDVDRPAARPVWTGEEEAEGDEAESLEDLLQPEAALATRGRSEAKPMPKRARKAMAPMARMADMEAAAAPAAAAAPDEAAASGAGAAIAAPRPLQLPVSEGRFLKKEWYREATIDAKTGAEPNVLRKVDEAVAELEEAPDSRDRHRDVTRKLSALGNLERTLRVIDDWIARDALDPEALTYLSDLVGRQGHRDDALRLLTGIVDLQPENRVLQSRLARGFDRAGLAERACAHRQALAHIAAEDDAAVADAVRCLRDTDRTAQAERLLQRIDDEARRERIVELAGAEAEGEAVAGDLMLSASWEGTADVDLSLITEQGTRVWWMGGRVNTVGEDGAKPGHERLGLKRATAGRYQIEISRTAPGDNEPVAGEVSVEVLGEKKKIPFELRGERARLGNITIRRKMRFAAP